MLVLLFAVPTRANEALFLTRLNVLATLCLTSRLCRSLGTKPAEFYRLETNWDHWKPDNETDGRRPKGNALMNATGLLAMRFGSFTVDVQLLLDIWPAITVLFEGSDTEYGCLAGWLTVVTCLVLQVRTTWIFSTCTTS